MIQVTPKQKTDIVDSYTVFFDVIQELLVDNTDITLNDLNRIYFHFRKTCKIIHKYICDYVGDNHSTECPIYLICSQNGNNTHKNICDLAWLARKCSKKKGFTESDLAKIKNLAIVITADKTANINFGINNL